LVVLGLFGSPLGRLGVFLDLRVKPAARPLGWVAGATLVLALSAGLITHSAYSARYLAVILVPVLALVALGVTSLGDARVRAGVLSAVVGLGLIGSLPNIATNRTQAGEVAAALAARGRPGDVVAYCPDQLGPAVDRLLPAGRYRQVAYPRGNGPAMVDWVDYDTVSRVFDPAAAARALVDAAGPQHRIWLVWSGAYPPLQHRCPQLLADLVALRPHFKVLFTDNSVAFYEHEELVEVRPGG
jgi:mannosyltransferase